MSWELTLTPQLFFYLGLFLGFWLGVGAMAVLNDIREKNNEFEQLVKEIEKQGFSRQEAKALANRIKWMGEEEDGDGLNACNSKKRYTV
ncbi:hypothetical protein [Archaeoglobus sp.]